MELLVILKEYWFFLALAVAYGELRWRVLSHDSKLKKVESIPAQVEILQLKSVDRDHTLQRIEQMLTEINNDLQEVKTTTAVLNDRAEREGK